MSKKTLLLTGTSGFIGYNFLSYALSKNYNVIDILRVKNKTNYKLKKLKKKYPKKYKNIFYSNYFDLKKKIKNLKVNYFINFAAIYKNKHEYNDIPNFIESNILFPTLIYDLIAKKTKKIINFGSMMQHNESTKLASQNLYAASKNAFEMICNYYSYKEIKTRFYHLKLYESFGKNDNRKKLIPIIIENYKKKKITKILSKKLELNIIHINDIINAIMVLLKNNIKPGSYCLKNNKNIKIQKLIKILNINLKNKIKVKYLKKTVRKVSKSNLKTLPMWKPDSKIIEKIKLNFINEVN